MPPGDDHDHRHTRSVAGAAHVALVDFVELHENSARIGAGLCRLWLGEWVCSTILVLYQIVFDLFTLASGRYTPVSATPQ